MLPAAEISVPATDPGLLGAALRAEGPRDVVGATI